MRAVWLREFGEPEMLVPGTAPDPAPGPGQVLVDAAHANITFVETMFRASGFGPFGAEPPVIGQRFPLERAADAHAAIEARETVGKTLLDVR
ncbi:zinc-binding dehydrogenase [Micromonospora marina]|uniref:Zinc-binding dehydrogenase n=1 Tax=Micromonospora marina TaxID=307120 RepID=A0A1C4V135_9ACTN|nr:MULTISPECIES: zinc-binding dehydrogenase [Micromonospora]SCE77596.1 Zinc-binding dehydrogenase [Micromonospora marina]